MSGMATEAARREAAYERFKAEYVSGAYFARRSFPDPIARYHGGPLHPRQYGGMMEAVARFASQGDWHAAVARHIFGKVNLYSTPTEAVAQVAGGISEFARKGYTDVVGMTGPEAGRPSQYTDKPVTERQSLLLVLLLAEVEMAASKAGVGLGHVPGLGWVVSRWMEEQDMSLPHYFPLLRAKHTES